VAKPALAVRVRQEHDRWEVHQDGLDEPLSVHEDREEAADAGREVANARTAEFFVYSPEGDIIERGDYRLEKRGSS
jgi:hypothetical protein